MKIFLSLDADKRVIAWGSTKGKSDDVEMVVPDTHEVLKNPFVFIYSNGSLQKDTAYQQKIIAESSKHVPIDERIHILERENADIWYTLMVKGVL